jgi:phospholipid/cholesterol/gamma-HCH transport system ATP-binding protein
MRRFSFGKDKGDGEQGGFQGASGSQGSPDLGGWQPPETPQQGGAWLARDEQSGSSGGPSASAESSGGGASSWVPSQGEPTTQRSDEPAPVHEEREHGLEGAQTPESDVAHPTSDSEEPDTAEREAPDDRGDERGHARGEEDGEGETEEQRQESRVSVVDEQPPRPVPPPGADDEEYKFHTYKVYPSGRPDAVEFIDTYKAFGRAKILRGLNMGLPEGMVSMILGPSGTGKSVCIKHMVGLLYPDEGDVLVHGESVPNMADDDLFEMRKKFGLLFQDGALFGSMNLYDNVAFPLRQHTEKGEDEVEDIVMRRLKEVGLADARDKMPNELSGGMRKRAGFARALVLEPDIVLFDEPDSGLDPVRTALLGELILEIHRDMMEDAKKAEREHLPTFCVITHDIMSARRVADYISVLWKGRIVEAGPAEDMLNSDNPFIRQFLAGESQGPLTMD